MKMTDYAHGAPCWFELETSDHRAVQAFWCGLLGWRAEDSPMPGSDHVYTMLSLGDDAVAACYQLDPEIAAKGSPPHWNIYFRVTDCDAATERASDAGGRVLAGPFDVDATFVQAQANGGQLCFPAFDAPGVGRIARINDAQGTGAYLITMPPGS